MDEKQLKAICQYLDSIKYEDDPSSASEDICSIVSFHGGGDEEVKRSGKNIFNLSYRARKSEKVNRESKVLLKFNLDPAEAERFSEKLIQEGPWGGKTLIDVVFELERKSGKTAADIYYDADLDRAVYSGICNGRNKNPTKKTVLALAIGFHLNETELKQFVNFCGYSFPTNYTDGVVQCFVTFENGKLYKKYEGGRVTGGTTRGSAVVHLNGLLQELKDMGKSVEILGSRVRTLE